MKYKYPRTSHIPNSNKSKDDITTNINNLIGKKVRIMEKMDGENTSCCTSGEVYSRSLESSFRSEYRTFIKNFWQEKLYSEKFLSLNNFDRIIFENCYAYHSVYYDNLLTYFYALNAWKEDICLSVYKSDEIFSELELISPKIYFEGKLNSQNQISDIISEIDTSKTEGIVIRITEEISLKDFSSLCMKWVRPNHITTNKDWARNWTKNSLNKY